MVNGHRGHNERNSVAGKQGKKQIINETQRNYKQKKINEDIQGKTESTHRKQEDNKKQALSFVFVSE